MGRGLYLDIGSSEHDVTAGEWATVRSRPPQAGRIHKEGSCGYKVKMASILLALGAAACATQTGGRGNFRAAAGMLRSNAATAGSYTQLADDHVRNPFIEPPEDDRALLSPTTPAPAPPKPETTAAPTSSAVSELTPKEDLHDGNPCDFNEEYHDGLCYKKCSILTEGRDPIRINAWTCCKESPCNYKNEKANSGGLRVFCAGYDVGGDGGCPHQPGACLKNEELHASLCYKKCSLLTGGDFPHRVGASTCCKSDGLGCIDIFGHDKSNAAFDVGGGAGDHDPSTPSRPHAPSQSLTEASTTYRPPEAGPVTVNASAGVPPPPPSRPRPEGAAGVCAEAEEAYGGLCYKKCSLLTHGEANIRTSSWTCCRKQPCLPRDTMGKITFKLLCDGYDVGANGKCPRAPGACPEDEENHGGICYKRCSILTDGAYPHRTAAGTCCKNKGLSCLLGSHIKTDPAFAVGSGVDKGNSKASGAKHLLQ